MMVSSLMVLEILLRLMRAAQVRLKAGMSSFADRFECPCTQETDPWTIAPIVKDGRKRMDCSIRREREQVIRVGGSCGCLLYTSDAADE